MRRFLLYVLFVGLWVTPVAAQQRSELQVLELANSHLGLASMRSTGVTMTAGRRVLSPTESASVSGGEPFYLVTSAKGLVIVSGDERMKPILGYTDNANFSLANIPPPVQELLSMYARGYDYLQKNPSAGTAIASQALTRSALPARVEPFLRTSWSQEAPYNARCPFLNGYRVSAGCVTIATAQVMKYYEYPERGRGMGKYHLYTATGVFTEETVDVSQEPLNWRDMASPSADVRNASTAWLVAACGAALSTKYSTVVGSNSIGEASVMDALRALTNNFDYNKDIKINHRDHYGYADWLSIIKTEIKEKRPVIASAHSSGYRGGHCFVFDGYDDKNLIHVNWGWGGSMDGFYEIDAMNPGYSGPGTTIGGYAVGQIILTNIKKPSAADKYVSRFGLLAFPLAVNPSLVARNGTFSLQEIHYSNLENTFSGIIQPVLVKDGQFTPLGTPLTREVQPLGSVFTAFDNLTIPSSLPDGDYQLYVATKDVRETEWQIVLGSKSNLPYYDVKIQAGSIRFSVPTNKNGLEVLSCKMEHKLYLTIGAKFLVNVKNAGTEWVGYIGMRLQSVDRPTEKPVVVTQDRISFLVGEKEHELASDVLGLGIPLPAGKYRLLPSYSYDGIDWMNIPMNVEQVVDVLPKPGNKFSLTLTNIERPRRTLTDKDEFKIAVTVKNTGVDPYDDRIRVSIKGPVSKELGTGVNEFVFIDSGGGTRTCTHALPLSEFPDGDYTVALYYMTATNPSLTIPDSEVYKFSVRTLLKNGK